MILGFSEIILKKEFAMKCYEAVLYTSKIDICMKRKKSQ